MNFFWQLLKNFLVKPGLQKGGPGKQDSKGSKKRVMSASKTLWFPDEEKTVRRIRQNYSPDKAVPEIVDSNFTKVLKKKKGAVVPKERWVFVILAGYDQNRRYEFVTREIQIGRQPENHIWLKDPKVSRFHAKICRQGSQLLLEDLHSTNGTKVNEERVRKKILASGDQIRVGETLILVSCEK